MCAMTARALRIADYRRRCAEADAPALHLVTEAEAVVAVAAMNAADRFVLAVLACLLAACVAFPLMWIGLSAQ